MGAEGAAVGGTAGGATSQTAAGLRAARRSAVGGQGQGGRAGGAVTHMDIYKCGWRAAAELGDGTALSLGF